MTIDYWECMRMAREYAKGTPFTMEVRKNTVQCGWNVYVKLKSNSRSTNIGKAVAHDTKRDS